MDPTDRKLTGFLICIVVATLIFVEQGVIWSMLVCVTSLCLILISQLTKQAKDHEHQIEKMAEKTIFEIREALKLILTRDDSKSRQYVSDDLSPLQKNFEELDYCIKSYEARAFDILDHMQQAVCSFGSEMKLNSDFSPYSKEIYGDKCSEGSDIIEYLFSNTDLDETAVASMKFYFNGVFGMAKLQWKISSVDFVKECRIKSPKGRIDIQLQYFPHFDSSGKLEKISVVTSDITAVKKAQKEVSRKQKEMEKIFALLEVPEGIFNQYMDETAKLFDRIKSDMKSLRTVKGDEYLPIVTRMFRDVHTIKGNSRLFNFNFIHNVSHNVETYLSDLKNKNIEFSKESVVTLTEKLMEINEEIYSYTSLRRDILGRGERDHALNVMYRMQWTKSLLHQFAYYLREPRYDIQETVRLQWELNRALESFNRASIMDYISRYDTMIEDLGATLGKKFTPLRHDLDFRYFDSSILSIINDIIVHCIRNACDHGIELPKLRVEHGKSEEGSIYIRSREADGMIVITIEDDGQGIDPGKVASRALALGFIDESKLKSMNNIEKMDLIFHPGLSTNQEVTEVSGRGVGMDAVRASVEEMGGAISVDSVIGIGSKFTISVPDVRDEFLSRFAIVDVIEMLYGCWSEIHSFARLAKVSMNLIHGEGPLYALADKRCALEILRLIFLEIFEITIHESSIDILFETLGGKRKMDSASFYRMKFRCSEKNVHRAFSEDSPHIKQAASLASYHSASVVVRTNFEIEFNIPTMMPFGFSDEIIRVLLLADEFEESTEYVKSFFNTTLNHWPHEVKRDLACLDEWSEGWGIVICSEGSVEEYLDKRGAKAAATDSIVLIASHTEGFDSIDIMDALPHHVRFVHSPVQERSLHQVLEAIILSRFISLMKNHKKSEADGEQSLVKRTA